ncbi:SRPBCC domain-containing protein [Bacillus sp. N3536]|nr:SRPBCC domain-containing protein [Bacillus sp. N3536]
MILKYKRLGGSKMKNDTEIVQIKKDLHVESSIDIVWNAWMNNNIVSQWFAPTAIIDPCIGGKYELYFIHGNLKQMNTKGCKIIDLVERQKLMFTWKAPDSFAEIMNVEDNLTIIEITLEENETNLTKINLIHSGYSKTEDWNEALYWHDNVLSSLKSELEKRNGNLCCEPLEEKN